MTEKNYEIFEHTADIGVRIKGEDLKDLFKNAGLAVFLISARKQYTVSKEHPKLNINLQAQDIQELFVNWLNEIISLAAVNCLVFHNIIINKLQDNCLEAVVIGSDVGNYKINTEIKAATHHQLKLEEVEGGWQAEVIFDV